MTDDDQLEQFYLQMYGEPNGGITRIVDNTPRFVAEWLAMSRRKPQTAERGGKITTGEARVSTFGPTEPANIYALDAATLESRNLARLLNKCMDRNLCYIRLERRDWFDTKALRATANTLLSVRERIVEDHELREILAWWDRSIRLESQSVFKAESWWTPDEAARVVGVSRETIMDWTNEDDASCLTLKWKPDRMTEGAILVDRGSVLSRDSTEKYIRKEAQRERMQALNKRRSQRLNEGVC